MYGIFDGDRSPILAWLVPSSTRISQSSEIQRDPPYGPKHGSASFLPDSVEST